jgi:hypothetical protein
MGAGVQKRAQPLGGERDRVRARDADDVEAERARLRGERALERRRAQKSRLA